MAVKTVALDLRSTVRRFDWWAATLGSSFTHAHACASVTKQYNLVLYLDRFFGIERRAHFAFDVAIDGSLTDALCVVQLGITRPYNHPGECRSFGFVR